MSRDKLGKILNYIYIIFFILFLIYIRASWFEQHFTHYDDIKVAQLTDFTVNVFDWNFKGLVWKGEIWAKVYNILCLLFSKIYNCIYYAANFSKYWTYAPGQFLVTFGILPLAYDYTSIKFFGRLPSLIFGCIAVILCWKCAKVFSKSDKSALAAVSIFGFSWQSILYCMHMSNYEAIILIGFISAYLSYTAINSASIKKWLLIIIAMGIMTWFHYQTICYLGGVMLVFLIKNYLEGKTIKKVTAGTAGLCIMFAIIVLPLLLFANMNGIPTWNVGVNGEYLYRFSFDIWYTLQFFAVNSFKVLKAMLSPVPLYTIWAQIIACIYIVFFVYGTVIAIIKRRNNSALFYLTVFCWGSVFAEYFFVFLGKFTLSPTRHSNVLIPVFVLQIMTGIYYSANDFRLPKWKKSIPYILSFGIALSWFCYAGTVKEERKDVFTAEAVSRLVNEYKPDIIVDRFAPQLWYLLGNEYTRREMIDYQTDFFDKDFDASNNKTIMIMSSTYDIDAQLVKEVAGDLMENGYLTKEAVLQLMERKPVAEYAYKTGLDFDFYNVTEGSANNFIYKIYHMD